MNEATWLAQPAITQVSADNVLASQLADPDDPRNELEVLGFEIDRCFVCPVGTAER